MSGCERILTRLERGPATAAELYAETFSVVHSRVSELRKRGHDIACARHSGEGAAAYVYTLRSATPDGPTPKRGPVGYSAVSGNASPLGEPEQAPGQLPFPGWSVRARTSARGWQYLLVERMAEVGK